MHATRTDSTPQARSSFTAADVGLFVSLAAIWGLSFLFIKVAVAEVAPAWLVAIRTVIGLAVLAVILRLRGGRLPRDRGTWRHLAVLGVMGNAVPWGLISWAQQSIPSGLSAVVTSLVPVSTLAVAAAVGLEPLTRRRLAGLGLAAAGTAVVVGSELGAPDRVLALLVVAGNTVIYGATTVYAKRFLSGTERPLTIAAGQVLVAAATMLPVAWWLGPAPEWTALSAPAIGSMVLLGAFGTGVAFLLYYLLVDRVGPTNATMVTYLMPVVGLTAGAVVLGERFGWHVLAGTGVIVVGIWLAQRTVPVAAAPRA